MPCPRNTETRGYHASRPLDPIMMKPDMGPSTRIAVELIDPVFSKSPKKNRPGISRACGRHQYFAGFAVIAAIAIALLGW
jgi:hypothetical protein